MYNNANKNLIKEENPIEEIEIETIQEDTLLYKTTLDFLKYYNLCTECLGRQFSYLGTKTDNTSRGEAILLSLTMEIHRLLKLQTVQKKYLLFNSKLDNLLKVLREKTNFLPVKEVFYEYLDHQIKNELEHDNDFQCDLCYNLLLKENTAKLVENIFSDLEKYEFDTFLVGTKLPPKLEEKEEEFRAKFNILHGESFKKNFNRLLGKILSEKMKKEVDFQNPQLTLILQINEPLIGKISWRIKTESLYIQGRYLKFSREIPQTKWYCNRCRGKGKHRNGSICDHCGGTGKLYNSSIEERIENVLILHSKGEKGVFHGSGREDIDARCIGNGRPFVFEVKNPKLRRINLELITNEINEINQNYIYIKDFSFVDKFKKGEIKNQAKDINKRYHALVEINHPISQQKFILLIKKLKEEVLGKVIYQRTPLRVVHRRGDMTREKQIFQIEGKYIDPIHFLLKLESQGGTYIKEFISGDNFRTVPSVSKVFNQIMKCVELDVYYIE